MPEPTRQSLCCSQPEHGPTLSHQMSEGRKQHMARPGLEPRTSRRLSYRATRSTCDNFLCLIRFVPESARNHAGTDETVPLLLAARARTRTKPPNVTGEKKSTWPDRDSNPGPLADRASTLTTELPSHTVELWQFPFYVIGYILMRFIWRPVFRKPYRCLTLQS